MKKITVTINEKPTKPYDIILGKGVITKIDQFVNINAYSKIAIITDENVQKWWRPKLVEALRIPTTSIILPPGEKEKNITSLQIIWQQLADAKFDRKSLIINLGGGVIGDIGGFAASTYMRGIDFINIPTSIVAQVDESVGGKTHIDFAGHKNLIGAFYQPIGVIIDVETLKTLPERDFIAGFAEIIKHGMIADKDYFDTVTAKSPLEFSQDELVEIIEGSCEIKRTVVEKDVREESGLRKTVNFGHTIGHVIELMSLDTDKLLLHGEAISIGMVAAAKLSQIKKYITEEDVELIKKSLQNAGLPTSIQTLDTNKVLEKIKADKKNVSGNVKWTLLKSIGKAVYNEEAEEEQVRQALTFIHHE